MSYCKPRPHPSTGAPGCADDGRSRRLRLRCRRPAVSYAAMVVLRADPWSPEYGMGFEPAVEESPLPRADPTVETEDWSAPIVPPPAVPGPVWFVDGVRRVELRLLADEGNRRVPGLFGSYAVGAVRCDGRASFEASRVCRAGPYTTTACRNGVRTAVPAESCCMLARYRYCSRGCLRQFRCGTRRRPVAVRDRAVWTEPLRRSAEELLCRVRSGSASQPAVPFGLLRATSMS